MNDDTKTGILAVGIVVLAFGLVIVGGLFLVPLVQSSRPIHTVVFVAGEFDYYVDKEYGNRDEQKMRFNETVLMVPDGEKFGLNTFTDDFWTIRGYTINGEDFGLKQTRIKVTKNLTIVQLPPVETIYKATLDALAENEITAVDSGGVRGWFDTKVRLDLDAFILIARDLDRSVVHHYRGNEEGIDVDWRWETWDYFFFLDGKLIYYLKLPLGAS